MIYHPCNNRPFLLELCQGADAIHQVKKDNTALMVGLGIAVFTGCVLYWCLQQQQALVYLPKQNEKR